MTEVRGEGKSWLRARVCHRTREKRRNPFLSAHLRGSWFGPWSNPAVTELIPGSPLSTMKVGRPELSANNDKVIHDVHDRFRLWATRLFELVVPGGGPGFRRPWVIADRPSRQSARPHGRTVLQPCDRRCCLDLDGCYVLYHRDGLMGAGDTSWTAACTRSWKVPSLTMRITVVALKASRSTVIASLIPTPSSRPGSTRPSPLAGRSAKVFMFGLPVQTD